MVWTARKPYRKPVVKVKHPPVSLEKLCKSIGNELRDNGESKGIISVWPAYPGFDITFKFAGLSFKDHYTGESEQDVLETGISNLRYSFSEPKYGIEVNESNIRIYVKPTRLSEAQI